MTTYLTLCAGDRNSHLHVVFDAPDLKAALALTQKTWPDFKVYGDEVDSEWSRGQLLGSVSMGTALIYKNTRRVQVEMNVPRDLDLSEITSLLADASFTSGAVHIKEIE